MTYKLQRPEPIDKPKVQAVDNRSSTKRVIQQLLAGEYLLLQDHYAIGVRILDQLSWDLERRLDMRSFAGRQRFQDEYQLAAARLLVPIVANRLNIADAPESGFLSKLYPDISDFVLPLIEVQELHGAWMRYTTGMHFPVLGFKLHPFYGAYAPTRMEHIELFATWLSQYKNGVQQAIDVGTGCGVLAFMLAKAGVQQVLATDCNPNAIESVRLDMARGQKAWPIVAEVKDLLGDDAPAADLIVFNPPWIPGRVHSMLDKALYYDDDIFARFFAQAHQSIKPQGHVVILFSNISRLLQPRSRHPIEDELRKGRFRLIKKWQRKVKPSEGRRTREKVEVWHLQPAKG